MKEYKQPTLKFFELKANLGFAQSKPGGRLSSDTIFGGTNAIITEDLD